MEWFEAQAEQEKQFVTTSNGPRRKVFKLPTFLALDFEFNQITSECVNLVSCVTFDTTTKVTRKFWLHNSADGKQKLIDHLKKYDNILGYACVAEARCFYALDLDPLGFNWVDLFLEYRMITNHNDRLNWGEQLVDGKVRTVKKPPPKWERSEQDVKGGFKPTHSLAEATFKLTGAIRDTEEKSRCRDLIISDPKKFSVEDREKILAYNAEDVKYLPKIWERIREEMAVLLTEDSINWEEYLDEAMNRGRYSAHTAIMESRGYPINYNATRNFSRQITSLLVDCQADINSQFKSKNLAPFKWDKKASKYTWNQKLTKEWLVSKGYTGETWMLTDKKQLSLSLEAFEKKFAFKHDYPRGNFGAQMVRYLKLKQSLYGFAESNGNRKTFWDYVGPDQRVRPYMNIFGAQSSRSQPAATGFMFLKPAWMRALVEPKEGYYLAGIDYGQQEFFLAALMSEDVKMIEAYLSGDPYLFIGKEAGAIPQDGTKKTHGLIRDKFKSTTLGIQYMMTKYGLSEKLTADTGEEHTEDEAQELIDEFESLFPDFIEWRKGIIQKYEEGYPVRTLDGWTVWIDNDNPRSVGNAPVQGAGAAIMRKAVDIAHSRGVKIIFTLHDAIYLEAKIGQEKDILKMRNAMKEAFVYFFEGTKYEGAASKIKLDPKAWGRHFPEKGEITVGDMVVPVSNLYIDPRSKAEYDKFHKYFDNPETDLL